MLVLKLPVQVALPVAGSGFGCAGVQVCASAGSDTPSDEDTSAEAASSQDLRRFKVMLDSTRPFPIGLPPQAEPATARKAAKGHLNPLHAKVESASVPK